MEQQSPLEGVKVLDFTWAAAGPATTKYLADYGAQVIKVESGSRLDLARVSTPFKDGVPGLEQSGLFHSLNSSKLSFRINLNHPQANTITEKLVRWADVVIENYAPGVMEKWALGYNDIRKFKPNVIMLRASLFGQTGPCHRHPGFGWNLNSLSGLTALTGWPDREAAGPDLAIPDFYAAWFAIVAILASLDYQRRTGQGQLIDLSEFEATLCYLSPELLDYQVNGRVKTRMGNRGRHAAPHSSYRCRGEDRWCAIAVFSDAEWETFCEVVGKPDWKNDHRFSTVTGRIENEEELDKLIEAWTINYSPEEIVERMQAAGIAAGVVKNSRDICEDPQLEFRGYFQPVEHPDMGLYPYPTWSARLSDNPSEIRHAPILGEHTDYICTEILGITDAEFIQLMTAGVFE